MPAGMALATAGAGLVSTAVGADAQRDATQAQTRAAGAAGAQSAAANQNYQQLSQPFAAAGTAALNPLLQNLGIDPYQAAVDQVNQQRAALQGLETTFADLQRAREIGGGGGTTRALQATQARQLEQQIRDARGRLAELQATARAAQGSQSQPQTGQPESLEGEVLDLVREGGTFQMPGAEVFDNPLLQATMDETQRRLFANQAASGRLGSGGTLEELQNRLAPTALNFGLTLADRNRQARQSTISGLLGIQGAREARTEGQTNNLFRLAGVGQNAVAGQGQAGFQGAAGVSNALINAGNAAAQGAQNQASQIQSGINNIAGIGTLYNQGFFGQTQQPQQTQNVVNTPSLWGTPIAQAGAPGTINLGPLQQSGAPGTINLGL